MASGDVRLGVILPSRELILAGNPDASLMLRVAERAEETGFDSVWLGDSLFHRPRFDPLTMLAAVAARTERVAVGTAVLIASQRHPLLLAQSVGTIDRISNGRTILGVGAGWIPLEFEALGIPFAERSGRLVDTMQVCRTLWSSQPVASRYWTFPEVAIEPKPVRPEGPPVWIGGSGPRALRAAGALFDGWMPTSPTPEAFAEGWETVRAHAAEAGRAPGAIDTAVYLTVYLTDDVAEGEEASARYSEAYYGIPFDVMRRAQAYFIGDEDACVAWLGAFVRAGVRHLLLRFATTDPLPQLERAAALVGRVG